MRLVMFAVAVLLSGPAMAQESGYIEDMLNPTFFQPAPTPPPSYPPVSDIYQGLPPPPTTTTCITLANGALICTTR